MVFKRDKKKIKLETNVKEVATKKNINKSKTNLLQPIYDLQGSKVKSHN